MNGNTARDPVGRSRAAVILAVSFAVAAAVLLLAQAASAAGRGQVIVELRQNDESGHTQASVFSDPVGNTDGVTRQLYKFQRQRLGRHFTYAIANLDPSTEYSVELSFVEREVNTAGARRFNVFVGSRLALFNLDIFSAAGAHNAFQWTVQSSSDARGLLAVEFRSDQPGCAGTATVSTIRVHRGGADVVEIDASKSRNTANPPLRHYNTAGQNTFEAVLGRLGSRACLDLLPQRLAGRFSTLGTWTADLDDLVVALKSGGEVRALPFTDRFPAWENIEQSQTMTSQTFDCSSGAMGLEFDAVFRAPFYPRNEKVSSAPFFYVDLTVRNPGRKAASGTLMFARSHKEEHPAARVRKVDDGTVTGLTCATSYGYRDETLNALDSKSAQEAIVLPSAESAGVTFRGATAGEYASFSADTLWGWTSPEGFPAAAIDPGNPVYSYYPRGYTGCTWAVRDLAPGGSITKRFVLACYTSESILKVRNSAYSDGSFEFRYRRSFGGVRQVADYAVSNRSKGDDLLGKSSFFDSTVFSDEYLALDPSCEESVRDLIACSFQTFLTNTWWARSRAGRDWFSVWEGTWMRFHGTVDVEYNQAWFYYDLWPGLLATVMDEWLLYLKSNEAGLYLPHDVGILDEATGQAYDHDMPVEENLNYILMLYRYWKSTGDTSYVRARLLILRQLTGFITDCDTNGNGLPDKHSQTTFDDGTPALERAGDQTYLGFKCLAAYVASAEMAIGASPAEAGFAASCRNQVELINQTLESDAWLSDHYSVCLDSSVEGPDRDAYSIHSGNGLLYLLGASREPGVTSTNFSRLRQDIGNATLRTWGPYGSRHTTFDPGRMWISTNLWRDALACYTGTPLFGRNPLALSSAYWRFERYLATNLWGGYWDGMIYGSGSSAGGGLDRRFARGGGPEDLCVPAPVGIVAERPAYFDYGGTRAGGHDVAGATDPASVFYFAEGTCRPGFDSYLCIGNPGGMAADVRITYMLGDGRTKRHSLVVAPRSRSTVRAGDVLGQGDDASHDFSAKVEAVNGAGIIAERPVYFNYGGRWAGGHDVVGAANPAPVFYFAEGTCRPGFDSYLCVGNPGDEAARCEITYMLGDGGTRKQKLEVDARSRATVRVSDVLGRGDDASHDFSAKVEAVNTAGIIAERPVYFNYGGRWAGGHDVVGAANPAPVFYFAEGTCRPGFDSYLCIANPGSGDADVRITYLLGDGGTREQQVTVGAHSRATVRVRDVLGQADDASHDFSAKVEAANGTGIIAERPMYFEYAGRWAGGHDAIGSTNPSSCYFFAEGSCRPGFDPYLCLANPGSGDAEVRITYLLGDGGTRGQSVNVGAHSRATVRVRDTLGEADDQAHDFSARVEVVNGTAGSPLMSYYPRGTASLGLIDAVAGLIVDVPGGSAFYSPAAVPLKVPVFSRADWSEPDPSKRVPTLDFTRAGAAPRVSNRNLLPARLGAARVRDIGDVTAAGVASGGGADATVSYDLPLTSDVTESIWDGSRRVRTVYSGRRAAGRHHFGWDGKDDSGTTLNDGLYRARIDALPVGGGAVRPASAAVYVNSSVPGLSSDWYLAEGYTGESSRSGDFEEYVLIANPGSAPARVRAAFMLGGGSVIERTFTAAASGRLTIRVDDILPGAEVSVHLRADTPIAVERSMYFAGRRAGHSSTGASSPATRWYIAEGCTHPGFDEYVLVMNPGSSPASVKVTFTTSAAEAREGSYSLPARSRFTIHVNDVLPGRDVSATVESDRPVVVERSQYLRDMQAGTCSLAARSLSGTWFLAEGCTGNGFQEYVLLYNPGPQASDVKLFFMEPTGERTVREYAVPAASRFTVPVGDVLPGREVSVEVKSEHPIAVERAMYWNGRSDGHCAIATPSPDTDWYAPDCYAGPGFETWLLLANPGDEPRGVTVTIMEPSGRNTRKGYRLAPRSRLTLDAGAIAGAWDFGVHVAGDGDIVVEKSLYFSGRQGGSCSTGIRGGRGGD